jgi:hypothetical protein
MNNNYSECVYTVQGVYMCKKKAIAEKFRNLPNNSYNKYYQIKKSYGSLSYRVDNVLKKNKKK